MSLFSVGAAAVADGAFQFRQDFTVPYGFLDLLSTPGVRAARAASGSRKLWENFKGERRFNRFTQNEVAFIAARDSFYIATVSEMGWPYVQHRGGPAGFLKVLDDKTLGFADFRGNRQFISLGNIATNNRVALILMDYLNRTRMKILAHMETRDIATDLGLAASLALPATRERWNGPSYCTLKLSIGIAPSTSHRGSRPKKSRRP